MKQSGVRRARRAGAAVFMALLLSGVPGCVTNPATGERRINLVSMEQEIRMGREADLQIGQTMGLYPDEALQAYVSEIGTEMARNSEWPDLPWTFQVIDDETVNAFALPGGYIYVTRGILAHFNSEAELAGVLGHEIGHVTARHATTRMSRMQMVQLGVGLAMILEPELQRLAPLASAGMQLLFLSYSRTDERESDFLGVRYMSAVGYDPKALIDVMETLRRVSEARGDGRLPQWLSTHPHPENRQENILDHIEDEGRSDFRPDARDVYLRATDGMVYGIEPREGYTDGSAFLHPGLRFRINFPEDWTVINQKQAVIAIGSERDASVQLTLSDETSIEAAARRLYDSEAVEGEGISRTRINGLPAGIGSFSVRAEQGPLAGTVAYIEYDGRIYQLIGYSAAGVWSDYRRMVNASLRSFRELTDPRLIEVEPMRIDLRRVGSSTTLTRFYDAHYRGGAPPVPLEEIALINQLEPDSRLAAGTYVKMVRGSPPPRIRAGAD